MRAVVLGLSCNVSSELPRWCVMPIWLCACCSWRSRNEDSTHFGHNCSFTLPLSQQVMTTCRICAEAWEART